MDKFIVATGLVGAALLVNAFVSTIVAGSDHQRSQPSAHREAIAAVRTAEERSHQMAYYSDFGSVRPASPMRRVSGTPPIEVATDRKTSMSLY